MSLLTTFAATACLLAANAACDGTGPLNSYNVVWESPSRNHADKG